MEDCHGDIHIEKFSRELSMWIWGLGERLELEVDVTKKVVVEILQELDAIAYRNWI